MAATILNLDALIPDQRAVLYKGKEHLLEVTSTEAYLKVLRARKKLGAIADDDEIGQTELAIELLVLALPTISKPDIMRLPLAAMMRLVEVVQGEMDLADNSADMAAEKGRDVTDSMQGDDVGESTLALSSPA